MAGVELDLTDHPDPDASESDPGAPVGDRIRAERSRRGIGVRELARLAECSPSLISQIELGRANPSVSTLYSLAAALNISVASLFTVPSAAPPPVDEAGNDGATGTAPPLASPCRAAPDGPGPRAHQRNAPGGPELERSIVLRRAERRTINLERGVRWELLLPAPEREVDFMEVVYQPFGGSTANDHAIRHRGREMAVLLAGVLSVQIGFEQYELAAGDSMAFDSTIPHRFWNPGAEPVRAIFVVLGRW